jgi:hypothetical protein
MIVTREYQIELQKGYDKVQYLYPACDETFVFLAHREAGKDIFVHCNLYGKALFELPFDDMVDSLALLSPTQAILLATRQNHILHIDLDSHATTHLPFEFRRVETEQSTIECFPDSRMFCVVEWGLYNDSRLNLSYFATPLLSHR